MQVCDSGFQTIVELFHVHAEIPPCIFEDSPFHPQLTFRPPGPCAMSMTILPAGVWSSTAKKWTEDYRLLICRRNLSKTLVQTVKNLQSCVQFSFPTCGTEITFLSNATFLHHVYYSNKIQEFGGRKKWQWWFTVPRMILLWIRWKRESDFLVQAP